MYEWHFIIISFNNTPVFGVFIARDWIRQWNMYTHTIRNEKKILWERDKRYEHRSKQMHCIYIEMAYVLQSVCAYPSKRMHGDSGVSVCTGEWMGNMRWKMEMDKRLLSICLFVFFFNIIIVVVVTFYLRLHSQDWKSIHGRTCRPTTRLTLKNGQMRIYPNKRQEWKVT